MPEAARREQLPSDGSKAARQEQLPSDGSKAARREQLDICWCRAPLSRAAGGLVSLAVRRKKKEEVEEWRVQNIS